MIRHVRAAVAAFATVMLAGAAGSAQEAPLSVSSPDGQIVVEVMTTGETGVPQYSVSYAGEAVIEPSRLGLRFRDQAGFDEGFSVAESQAGSADTEWEQPWGERRIVRDHHNQLTVSFAAEEGSQFDVSFKVFNDGLGFRYEVPAQDGYESVAIVDELTEFRTAGVEMAWWIPARGWNRYEYLYETTGLDEIEIAHTPMTMRTGNGVHLSIHEAALVDYAGMALKQQRPGTFEADLAPRSDGVLVMKEGAFTTPWRTIQIAPDAVGLLNSDLILNLNEPNALGDVDWVEPGKYIGIWWAMHINDRSWGTDFIHGATTEETKRYLDFAAENGFDGVLVEGWNIGWDGDWYSNGDVFSFTEAYPDFDIGGIADYAREKGVRLIGHHETSGNISNYERQMDAAYDLYEKVGVRQVKTGYVADGGDVKRVDGEGIAHYEWHDNQIMVNHYLHSVKEAAKRKISINTHEPIKATGLRRTYPNWIAREGARGQEYNAWGQPPNTPEHTTILPYTRMLSGPMDFTPGIFDLMPNERPKLDGAADRHSTQSRIETTLAKQLALYVVIYSPIQMAADLPENYEARPEAFQFIRDVVTDWEESIALAGEVGDYAVFARQARGNDEWFLGGVTDEEARSIEVPLDFLEENVTYTAEYYLDAEDADWESNPYAMNIGEREVTSDTVMALPMAPGGGAAVRFYPSGE